MHSTNPDYRCHLLTQLPRVLAGPSVGERLRFVMPHLLALSLLDLEPARPLLSACYSGRKGGHPPRDPVAMLRSLMLMVMCGHTDPNIWCKRLQGEPELKVISGFNADGKRPGVGTFYDFMGRLLDGPYQPRCAHRAKLPSELLQGRSFARHLQQEKEAVKAQTQAELAQEKQKLVELRAEQALSQREQRVPQDLTQRLNELLMRCAVVPSAAMGMLGDLGRLVVSGDGTALDSHASGEGHTFCECRAQGQPGCQCPRYYSDPEATWGYDSARERYYFGYRLHLMTTRSGGEDLPLQVLLEGAHTADVLLGIEGLSRLVRRLAEPDMAARIYAAVYDRGYDAVGFYRLHCRMGIRPVIPLSQEVKTPMCQQGHSRDEQGRPLCAASLPMRLHQRSQKELVYNCPVKRPTREQGKLVIVAREQECPRGVLCEPDSVMGPLVHIKLDGDPRMNLAIPRESEEFARLYKDRTAKERYNSTLKSKGSMESGASRRKHVLHALAVLHAIELHADVWVKRLLGNQRPMTAAALLEWLAQPAELQKAA